MFKVFCTLRLQRRPRRERGCALPLARSFCAPSAPRHKPRSHSSPIHTARTARPGLTPAARPALPAIADMNLASSWRKGFWEEIAFLCVCSFSLAFALGFAQLCLALLGCRVSQGRIQGWGRPPPPPKNKCSTLHLVLQVQNVLMFSLKGSGKFLVCVCVCVCDRKRRGRQRPCE